MRVAVLSPHRDDAAFSCGLTMIALLQQGADLTVVNVFTRSDYAIDLQTIDTALPLVDAVSWARQMEDERFVADVAEAAGREPASVLLRDLDEFDAPLRLAVRTEQVLESPLTDAEVQHEATVLAQRLVCLQTFDLVFAPLALGDHIDHRIAREASKLLIAADRLCFYEDLPYAARMSSPERKQQTRHATVSNPSTEYVGYTLHLARGPHLKTRFAMHYPSQIAPEVAQEMAEYAAQQADQGAGAERWWATSVAGSVIVRLLESASSPCSLVEEP